MASTPTQMTAQDVIHILKLLAQHKIEVVVDGGWGVDALLGQQTRPHEDLDMAVNHRDVPKIWELFTAMGYREIVRDDSWECNFVLGDEHGHVLDFHSCTFDEDGNNIFGVDYAFESWQGYGMIDGCQVKCIPPEWMVKFHTGYALDENDYHDVKLLCQKFNIPVPDEYDGFLENESNF
ncbi:MAG: nucleotidyltransferase family protein [Anaerolineaceae bacterium]|nr:nucleotidyltransferase family protein [Anaerolineaceae bacterium]